MTSFVFTKICVQRLNFNLYFEFSYWTYLLISLKYCQLFILSFLSTSVHMKNSDVSDVSNWKLKTVKKTIWNLDLNLCITNWGLYGNYQTHYGSLGVFISSNEIKNYASGLHSTLYFQFYLDCQLSAHRWFNLRFSVQLVSSSALILT